MLHPEGMAYNKALTDRWRKTEQKGNMSEGIEISGIVCWTKNVAQT